MIEKNMLLESDMNKLKDLNYIKNGEVTSDFLHVYWLYSKLLLDYIDKNIALSDREEEVQKSVICLTPIKKEEKDSYQLFSPLKFFYIRNNLKIERIPLPYLEELKERFEKGMTSLDFGSERIIRDTYEKVICNENYKNGTNINYGPTTSIDFFAPNNAIVLGIRIDPEYEKDTQDNPEWLDNFMKRKILVHTLINKIQKESEEKFSVPLRVIEYDENSVKKNNKVEEHFKLY